jgi:histidinol phosphatase-like enzyme (inositol monophosphatase family)
MRAILKRSAPNHGIAGEELDDHAGSEPYTWILDPIDGTRAYMSGLPVWGTLIGLVNQGTPIIGVMDQPFTGERFTGSTNGSHLHRSGRPTRLKTRATTTLANAILSATGPELFKSRDEKAAFTRLEDAVKLRRFGYDCYAYAMVAAGHMDLVVEAGLKAVDIAPLIPIIEGAGGIVTSWDGTSAVKGGNVVAAANATLHRAALDLINRR